MQAFELGADNKPGGVFRLEDVVSMFLKGISNFESSDHRTVFLLSDDRVHVWLL